METSRQRDCYTRHVLDPLPRGLLRCLLWGLRDSFSIKILHRLIWWSPFSTLRIRSLLPPCDFSYELDSEVWFLPGRYMGRTQWLLGRSSEDFNLCIQEFEVWLRFALRSKALGTLYVPMFTLCELSNLLQWFFGFYGTSMILPIYEVCNQWELSQHKMTPT